MRAVLLAIHRFADHPWTNLLVAVILIATALSEVGTDILTELTAGDVGAHHGVLCLGLVQGLKALPEVAEGLNKLLHGPDADDLPPAEG